MEAQLAKEGRGDGASLHRKVRLSDVLHLPVWQGYATDAVSPRPAAAPPANRLVLRFGAPLVALCCVRVMGVVLRVQHDVGSKSVVLYIDDSTGVMRMEYPAINLAYVAKQPEVGDLLDLLGEVCYQPNTGERYINAYGMDYKRDGNWEALRYLELVDLYRHHYYKEAFKDDDGADPTAAQEDADRIAEYAAMTGGGGAAQSNASKRRRVEPATPVSQDRRSMSSQTPSRPQVTASVEPVAYGEAIEAMLRRQGSASRADLVRQFPLCTNLGEVLDNMMLDGLLYEKDGRYHAL